MKMTQNQRIKSGTPQPASTIDTGQPLAAFQPEWIGDWFVQLAHTSGMSIKYLPDRFVTIRYFTCLPIAVLVKATLPFWGAFQRDHLTALLDQPDW